MSGDERRPGPPLFLAPWRQQVQDCFPSIGLARKPALRRSPRADALLSVDLPACGTPEAQSLFLSRLSLWDWHARTEAGWTHLCPADLCLPEEIFGKDSSGEAACLRTLLLRHPGKADSRNETLLLLKAREESPRSWEDACRRLHQDFARRLRKKESLPAFRFHAAPWGENEPHILSI